eukprot:6596785-Prorocentrum_lima.AAC.1
MPFFVIGLEEGGSGLATTPLAPKPSILSSGGQGSLMPQRAFPEFTAGLLTLSATLSKCVSSSSSSTRCRRASSTAHNRA